MNAEELPRAYGDSHTLDRPTGTEVSELFHSTTKEERHHPLDHRDVVEEADSQGWGS